ncbi:unnamed protein product, partial [Owenia fusiformis]
KETTSAMEKHASKTLFVRNLPFSTTNDKLESLFGDIGPLKKCFVVKDKDSKHPCRGYGYVTFSMSDDAEKAQTDVKSLDGRKLFVSFADRKIDQKKKGKKQTGDGKEDETVISPAKDATKTKQNADKGPKTFITLRHVGKDVLRSDIAKILGKDIPVSQYEFEEAENKAVVHFDTHKNAVKAFNKLNKKTIKGHSVEAGVGHGKPTVADKRSRLIIRNLSFKCKEDDLKEEFTKHGTVTEVKIPSRPNGKHPGFGFIQFQDVKKAAKAIEALNTKAIKGRPVAVDWAIPREKYIAVQEKQNEKTDDSNKNDSDDNDSDNEMESDSPSDSDNDNDIRTKTKKSHKISNLKRKHKDSDSNEDSDTEVEEDSEDDDNSEESDQSDDDKDSDLEGSDEGSESDMEESDEDEVETPTHPKKTDVDDGRTLFIRNISFETPVEKLEEMLSQFGEIEFCRLVIDPNTDHPRGSGFVKFKTKDAMEQCLQQAEEEDMDGGITIDGRKLNMIVAVSRDKAQAIKASKKEKEPKDNRNLYLAREGMIRPGTQGAEGLDKTDLDKRMKVDAVKRQKLKNPQIFISKTRLCVRNLPTSTGDTDLRQIYLKATGDNKAKISECRIMRDLTRVNEKGVAKSRGYAFIEFTEHKHALAALRQTNNNPAIFGEKKRPIVEFSLENTAALNAKKKRMERIETKNATAKRGKNQPRPKQVKKQKQDTIEDPESEEMKLQKKKGPKGLPSHWGPKIRHNPRGPVKSGEKPKDRLSRKQLKKQRKLNAETNPVPVKIHTPTTEKKAPKKRNRKAKKEQTDSFDNLVSKYRKTITSANLKKKGGKWFD